MYNKQCNLRLTFNLIAKLNIYRKEHIQNSGDSNEEVKIYYTKIKIGIKCLREKK